MPSIFEMIIIAGAGLIVLGPKRLPKLAKTIGQVLGELRRYSQDFKMSLDAEIAAAEHEESLKQLKSKDNNDNNNNNINDQIDE